MLINKVLILSMSIIVILSSILVGDIFKSNIEIANAIIAFVSFGYLIWNCKKKKVKLINNKLDIFVLIFMFAPYIPLIFGTYISLENTILSIFQNISITAIYFLAKEIQTQNNTKHSWLEFIILLSSIIIFIIGIDDITTGVFSSKLQTLGISRYLNPDERFIANIGYANSAAIVMAISSFILLGLSTIKKRKICDLIYGTINFCYMLGILLAVSKGTILCYGIFIILYLLLVKEKEDRISTIIKALTSVIVAVLYVLLFNRLKPLEQYTKIWLLILAFGIITGVLWLLINKLNKYYNKITKKHIIIGSIIILTMGVAIFVYGLDKTAPLTLFTSSNGNDQYIYLVNNMEGEKEYSLVFYIDAKTNTDNKYKIHIDEQNVYEIEIVEHEVEFGEYSGEQKFNFTTNADTRKLKIVFIREQKEDNAQLVINKFTMNDKEIPLKYKYLPTFAVNMIKNVTTKNKGVWERGAFILDGMKIAKNNFWFGAGGNAWEYLYGTVQEYNYTSKETHCFYTKVIIENGILGEVAVLGIIICIIIYSVKYLKQQRDIKYIAILCAIRSAIDA